MGEVGQASTRARLENEEVIPLAWFRTRVILQCLAFLVVLPTANALCAELTEPPQVMTTVNRMEIVIEAPATSVWPFLLDLGKWMPDHQEVEYLNEHWGAMGGTLRRRMYHAGHLEQDRIEEIIDIEPARRLTVHIHFAPPDPTHTDVIANLELTAVGKRKTKLRLDIYMSTVPAEPLDFAALQDRKEQSEREMAPQLRDGFGQLLKAAVEKARSEPENAHASEPARR